MEDCVFCKIIKGDIPSYKIYEDEYVISFLDISPTSKGHTLVIPKKHYKDILEISEEDLCNTMKALKKVCSKIKEKYNPDGFVIRQNNGEKAGQSVFHIHFHIKPVYSDTKVLSDEDCRTTFTNEEMGDFVNQLKTIN